ncbi:MAG: phosphatidate cytidylyltransferase [Planctomycetota bacterium]
MPTQPADADSAGWTRKTRYNLGVLRDRLLLGPLLIAVVFGVFWLDERIAGLMLGDMTLPPGTAFTPTLLILLGFTAWEVTRMLRDNGVEASTVVNVIAMALGLLSTALSDVSGIAVASASVAVLLISLGVFAKRKTFEGVVASTGGAQLVFVYLGILGGFWVLLIGAYGPWVGLWVLCITKSCDIGAYFTGRWFGRHKLAPWLSPGKTQEGLLGGVLFSAAIAMLGMLLLRTVDAAPPISILGSAFVGAATGLLGQVGDLIASLLKRDAGRKDASRSLPGFGGWLDVLDSPLLVGVAAYWCLQLVA